MEILVFFGWPAVAFAVVFFLGWRSLPNNKRPAE
jgi:hypothetical protein